MVELIKNYEYSISQLNQALNVSVKREFNNEFTQTEAQKPLLLTFMKQLVGNYH